MKWRKLGLLYAPSGEQPWARTHAMMPTLALLPTGGVRLFLASADSSLVSRIGYLDLAPMDPTRVIGMAQHPVLDIGRPGCFDDNGVNPSCIVPDGGALKLYYVGYQLQRKIPYTLFTGMAISQDDGASFTRVSEVPVLDRGQRELFFRTAPFIIRRGDRWQLWYIGGSGWIDVRGKPQPTYSLCYAESGDGINWPADGVECLKPDGMAEIGFGRPFVMRDADGYRMWYSIRRRQGYTLGYAVSDDGQVWQRRDAEVGIKPSASGWDSEMICYASVYMVANDYFMFYNGNGYGRTGIGVALLEQN